MENIPPLQLEAPEACHLLPSIETVLGDDVLIMTRLSRLVDSLLVSNTLVKVYDRPLTPVDSNLIFFFHLTNDKIVFVENINIC